jgi:hypothetical protein
MADLHHWLMTACEASFAKEASDPFATDRGNRIANREYATKGGPSVSRNQIHE